jgi:hypothetical protein
MQIANVRLRLNKVGSDVPLKDVTPAEAMFLHILHGPSNGGSTFGEEFEKITVIGSAKVQGPATPAKPAVGVPGQPGFVAAVPASDGLRDRTPAEEYRRLAARYNGARDKLNKPIIESIWPDRLNPKMPDTFKEIQWAEIAGTGIETAAVNYATGGLAQSVVPNK